MPGNPEVPVNPDDIVSRDAIVVSIEPTTHTTLLICTGTAVFDFEGTGHGISNGTLLFDIPEERDDVDPLTHPLDVSRFLQTPGTTWHEATVGSLASFTGDTGPWAVDNVELSVTTNPVKGGPPTGKFLHLQAHLAVGEGSHLLRVAYQANVLFFVT